MSIRTEYTQESQLNQNALYIVTVSLLEYLSNFRSSTHIIWQILFQFRYDTKIWGLPKQKMKRVPY